MTHDDCAGARPPGDEYADSAATQVGLMSETSGDLLHPTTDDGSGSLGPVDSASPVRQLDRDQHGMFSSYR